VSLSGKDSRSAARSVAGLLGTTRRVLWVLFAYHAMFLLGAGVLLLAVARASFPGEVFGVALIAAGGALQQIVLRWSADLTRKGTPFVPGGPGVEIQSRTPDPRGRYLCPSCGWRGVRGAGNCPRCGRFLVHLPSDPGTSPVMT
jgi:hypothetical protein